MRTFALTIVALAIMLSLGSVLFVSVLNFSHTFDHHEMASGMADCPFMTHEETICPMTTLDHLFALRSLFETTIPGIVALTLIVGVALAAFIFAPKLKPLLQLHAHTFLRWRQRSTYTFPYRLFQELFARGILHPKLFS